jgi:WD40 repeat protein
LCFDCEGQLGATLNVSEFAITDLVYCRSPDDTQRHLAVAAADGSIAVWSCSTKERPADLTKDFVLQPPRSTTLAVSLVTLRGNSLVVAGFTCGHIRVYSIVGRALVVEIAAHARPISTLAASRHRSQILSAGEDSVLNLWTVAEDSVTLDFSHKLQNTMVVGGCFVGEKDSALAVSAYDYDGVFAWTLPKSAKP